MRKYEIESPDAWVWRIAHNRYARFVDKRKKTQMLLSCEDVPVAVVDDADAENVEEQYETVFRYLHTLSAAYRDIFVDHYIGGLSVKRLAERYALPETTVKWRLNVSRQKIRDRIGADHMEKIYQKIHWNTTTCNGSLDADAYLHTQVARAICRAAYETPLTVEEISICTGIPTMYVEDELPRLVYGDAICRTGNRYATDFILFRLQDKKQTEDVSAQTVGRVADRCEAVLRGAEAAVRALGFFGSDFGMDRLGHIALPYLLRHKLVDLKNNRLHLESGPYPPRKDGGCGWFIVEETADETEACAAHNAGCNAVQGDGVTLCYYWVGKYFDADLARNGMRRLCDGVLHPGAGGVLPENALPEEDAAHLVQANLLEKDGAQYRLRFPCFTAAQFRDFVRLFTLDDAALDDLLTAWIAAVRDSFARFVPPRLHGQINAWIGGYLHRIIGFVTDELIRRGALRAPEKETPLTDGVFCIEGTACNP